MLTVSLDKTEKRLRQVVYHQAKVETYPVAPTKTLGKVKALPLLA
jgi:hypothetical protein